MLDKTVMERAVPTKMYRNINDKRICTQWKLPFTIDLNLRTKLKKSSAYLDRVGRVSEQEEVAMKSGIPYLGYGYSQHLVNI